ncbi:MAG: sigma 54-interacting transcriptional regulator [Deltaproteobacteria bacterium]|nr:sigma 54-interacting transcriptional regulator [Deltaproteobacteria bacterium]
MTSIPKKVLNPRFVQQIIDCMAEGVFTLDQEGTITSWNPAMERISGYPAMEVMGKTCEILQFSRCVNKVCPTGLRECGLMQQGKTEAKECHLRHREGHDVPVIKNARVVRDESGQVIGVVETLTDLSELADARRKAEEAALRLKEMYSFSNLIGKSRAMVDVFDAIRAAAASDAAVLIQGESGTGKELVAGAIHHNSPRASRPLVMVNCSALPESLLESELFGHVRGAFTGALRDRKGRFEEADGGTVFLDEIGELSPFIQIKLLRVLQEKEIERVGESLRRKIDIRILAATHVDLRAHVQKGLFREDLFYRLKVFPLHIPPLRKRREDIPLLIDHFIRTQNTKTGKRIRAASQDAMKVLMAYPWPGNVRELENAVEHAFVLAKGNEIDVADLPVEMRQATGQQPLAAAYGSWAKTPSGSRMLSREDLLKILDACDWNKAEAGRRLGLSRTAIWKYMKKWNIPLRKPTGP